MKGKDLIINKNPKSLFAESIRSIRTNLTFASLDKNIKVIINTSPEAGDGKRSDALYSDQRHYDLCVHGSCV